MIALTRHYRFPAAHVLRSSQLSDEENVRVYGKCTALHGHDYALEVTVTGPVDPVSGRIVSPQSLDRLVQRHVLERLSHRNLNEDPRFRDRVPTAENIARVIHEELAGPIGTDSSAQLLRIRVHETRRNRFEYGDAR